jgi:D-alanyl-D-alanine carboxypeptidase
MNKRQKAILKRNIFLGLCGVVIIVALALIAYIISTLGGSKDTTSSSDASSQNISSEVTSSEESSSTDISSTDTSSTDSVSENTSSKKPTKKLDEDFQNLTLVNGWNPLPEDFDYEGHLTTIPQKYIKGSLTQIDKDVWPYLKAMLDDARDDGIDMGVWSPYRSYATQKMLFERQIKKQIANGVPKAEAEDKAATVVARPGTSEHNTGLALDINCANSSFENTKAYKWLERNAENYGFIMRYREDKQEKTGVIHESWHWRFVGINAAKEINQLDMCLEEYVEYKK